MSEIGYLVWLLGPLVIIAFVSCNLLLRRPEEVLGASAILAAGYVAYLGWKGLNVGAVMWFANFGMSFVVALIAATLGFLLRVAVLEVLARSRR